MVLHVSRHAAAFVSCCTVCLLFIVYAHASLSLPQIWQLVTTPVPECVMLAMLGYDDVWGNAGD